MPLLVSAAIVGNRLGMRLHRRIPARAFRTLVAVLVIVSGTATIIA